MGGCLDWRAVALGWDRMMGANGLGRDEHRFACMGNVDDILGGVDQPGAGDDGVVDLVVSHGQSSEALAYASCHLDAFPFHPVLPEPVVVLAIVLSKRTAHPVLPSLPDLLSFSPPPFAAFQNSSTAYLVDPGCP